LSSLRESRGIPHRRIPDLKDPSRKRIPGSTLLAGATRCGSGFDIGIGRQLLQAATVGGDHHA
jgi:hypothetical protein